MRSPVDPKLSTLLAQAAIICACLAACGPTSNRSNLGTPTEDNLLVPEASEVLSSHESAAVASPEVPTAAPEASGTTSTSMSLATSIASGDGSVSSSVSNDHSTDPTIRVSADAPTNSLPVPVDANHVFWLTDGYDLLSGQRKESCLDPNHLQVRSYPMRTSTSTVDLVVSTQELTEKLGLQYNADVSGLIHGVKITPSIKGEILRETDMTKASLVALVSFKYVRDRLAIYGSSPALSESSALLLQQDPKSFRAQCGDEFTRSLDTGASLYLIFRAEQRGLVSSNTKSVETALKIGMSELAGVSGGVSTNSEQKSIINSFRISVQCYSAGTSARPCGDSQLNLSEVKIGDTTLMDAINNAKKQLAAEVENGEGLAVIAENREHFYLPDALKNKAANEVFSNPSQNLKAIQSWLDLETSVATICGNVEGIAEACASARESIQSQIASCVNNDNLANGNCRKATKGDLSQVTHFANAGRITLFTDTNWQGTSLTLDLSNVFGMGPGIKANYLYSLHDEAFADGKTADRVSSIFQELKPGWQLELYEHIDGSGRRYVIRQDRPQDLPFGRFNDLASSFRLVRVPRP